MTNKDSIEERYRKKAVRDLKYRNQTKDHRIETGCTRDFDIDKLWKQYLKQKLIADDK